MERNDSADEVDRGDGFLAAHRTLAFVGLTLALSWAWWFGAATLTDGGLSKALVLPGGFGPPVAALAVAWATGDFDKLLGRIRRVRVGRRWYAVALALPPVAMAGATLLYAGVGGPVSVDRLGSVLPAYPVLVVALALVGGGQEEVGWRGYALPKLQATHGPLLASLAVGVAWAVWHAPLFVLGGAPSASGSFPLYLGTVLAFSVVFTWLFNRSGGSVPLAMLLHGGVNAGGSVIPVPPDAVGEWGLAVDASIAVAFGLVALGLLALSGTDLGYDDTDGEVGKESGRRATVTGD